MIYPTFGFAMLAHMAVVTVGKIKNFANPKNAVVPKKNGVKQNIIQKILRAFFIAAIIEIVLFFVVGTSLLAVYVGLKSNNSNLGIIENLYKVEIKNIKLNNTKI